MSFQNPLPPGIRQVVPDYVSDGATLAWGFPFRLWAAADIYVGVSNDNGETWTQLVLGTNYTVAINGVISAIVTLTAPQPAQTLIRLMGLRTPSRTTSVVNDGVLQSAPFESELDVVEATMQELRRDVTNAYASVIAAETQFEANINAQLTALQTSVAVETARAEAAEAALATSLAAISTLWLSGSLSIGSPATLPTTKPTASGAYWNDGGVLAVTAGGTLPTSAPAALGAFWSNGGIVCVTPGGFNPLPGVKPSSTLQFWNNGDVICIS